jgi:hypothetical protein
LVKACRRRWNSVIIVDRPEFSFEVFDLTLYTLTHRGGFEPPPPPRPRVAHQRRKRVDPLFALQKRHQGVA